MSAEPRPWRETASTVTVKVSPAANVDGAIAVKSNGEASTAVLGGETTAPWLARAVRLAGATPLPGAPLSFSVNAVDWLDASCWVAADSDTFTQSPVSQCWTLAAAKPRSVFRAASIHSN